jgi:asparagine synthase (glutamine-hydrolysing)
MCGIIGFYLNRALNEKDIKKGIDGLKSQNHRGPDFSDTWINKKQGIFLGHNRLSIIDLNKSSNQPMEQNNVVLTYNGEIYNYKILKEKYFNKRVKFNSNSDTEVLLKLWNLKKERSLEELDGMFAFAVFKKNLISLAVDPFGEKPLYYFQDSQGIYFASEIEALSKICNFKLREDNSFVSEFLLFGYINSPFTPYDGVKKVSPSTLVQFRKENGLFKKTESTYWEKPKRNYSKGKSKKFSADHIKQLKNLIIQSVESRLVSDVPLGLFLSSGIDSSLIASIISLELKKQINCYTVKFDKNLVHDESFFASKIANYLNLDHEVLVNKSKLEYSTNNLLKLYSKDYNDNPTIFSYYEMSLLASKKIKVAISGLGGDELFLGYNRYYFFEKYFKLIMFLKIFKTPINYINFKNLNSLNKLDTLNKNFLNVPINEFYLRYKNLDQFDLFNQDSINVIKNFFDLNDKNLFEEFFMYDIEKTMPCSYIPCSDMGGMKASLEIRSPFLNKEIYEFLAENFNHKEILKLGGKKILSQILSSYIPLDLIPNKKRGFIFPIDKLLHGEGSSYINKRVLLRKKILNEGFTY